MVDYGYKQKKGLDYVKTFVVIIKPINYKCLFIVRVKCGYQIWQINVVTTILYALVNKIFYVE